MKNGGDDDEIRLAGLWWDPAAPSDKFGGTAQINRRTGETTLEFARHWQESGSVGSGPTWTDLCGAVEGGKRVSLLHGHCESWHLSPANNVLSGRFFAHVTLIGGNAGSVDEILLDMADVHLAGFTRWVTLTALTVTHNATSAQPLDCSITYSHPQPLTLGTHGPLSLSIESRLAGYPLGDWDGDLALDAKRFLRFDYGAGIVFDQFLKDLWAAQCMLTVFRGAVSQTESVRIRLADSDKMYPAVEVQLYREDLGAAHAAVHPGDCLVRFEDVSKDLPGLFARWFAFMKVAGTAVGLYRAALSKGDLTARFIAASQAIEVLHRLTDQGVYISKKNFEDNVLPILAAAIPATLEKEFATSINQRLGYMYEFTLRKRLKALCKKHKAALESVAPEVPEMVGDIVELRNNLTHYSAGATFSTNNMHRYTQALITLFEFETLSQIHFTPDEIEAKAVRRVYVYKRRGL